jgi:sporadic carbohydrate cluster 2OG-Fe(II) oxygenase
MFLSKEDQELGTNFSRDGYIIKPVANEKAFQSIEDVIFKQIEAATSGKIGNREHWLNHAHEHINLKKLNDFRLSVIKCMNDESNFRLWYYQVAKPYLEALVGNELAMQLRVNLSIQLPNDSSSLLPVHADTWSGDSPFEAVVWLPLVDCHGSKTMFLLPPDKAKVLTENFSEYASGSSEDIFRSIEKDLEWIEIKRGEVLIFNQTLPHGNRQNREGQTRWSMNCRFKGVFTPYADKKVGEFFEPITLRKVSELGLKYQIPKIS